MLCYVTFIGPYIGLHLITVCTIYKELIYFSPTFQEDIKSLCTHVVEHFGPTLDKITYVQTFKALRLRYDQHQDRQKDRQTAQLEK